MACLRAGGAFHTTSDWARMRPLIDVMEVLSQVTPAAFFSPAVSASLVGSKMKHYGQVSRQSNHANLGRVASSCLVDMAIMPPEGYS